MSPTQRTLAMLRKDGWTAAVVERFNPHAKVRQDLFGFIDLVAVRPDHPGVLAVQACVTGDQSKRLAKIAEEPRARTWLAAGNPIQVIGWAKRGARGKRKTWTVSITPVTESMLVGREGPGVEVAVEEVAG